MSEQLERIQAELDAQIEKMDGTRRDNRDTAGNEGSSAPAEPGHSWDKPHFELHEDDGVYWCDVIRENDGIVTRPAAPVWICSPLYVEAMTRDTQNGEWGRLLVFYDADGNEHRWTCPQSMHAGNGDELRAVLLREGLTITTNTRDRRRIGDYIQQANPTTRARCVDRTGWHGDVFVLPRETYGDSKNEPVLFQAASIDGAELGRAGTLNDWIANVSAVCVGNSRLVMSICAGFAGPCVGLLRAEGGGLHLRGPSSTGKSTALQVAASIFGAPESYTRTWRTTDNGLEGTSTLHSDLLLVLDEIGQLDPKHAGAVAYMLANGQGKARSHRDGSPRTPARWRVLFLSSGEVGLSDLVAQSGQKVRAGQEVRVVDLPAEAKYGLFDRVPEDNSPAAFADTLKAQAAKHYGHALPAFLQVLVRDTDLARNTLSRLRDAIASAIAPPDSSGQVRRVADRFALLAATGELATVHGLTGWDTGEAEQAAIVCFKAWLESRGTAGNSENAVMLAQVRAFLEANGEARFTRWDAPEDGERTIKRAGYRKQGLDGPTYYIERECFRQEICKGFDHRAVANVLQAENALYMGSQGETTRKERLPDNRNVRMYVITPAIWGQQ